MERRRVLGLELNRLSIIGYRSVVIILCCVRLASVVECECVLGIEPDRLAKLGNCAVVVVLFAILDATANVSLRRGWRYIALPFECRAHRWSWIIGSRDTVRQEEELPCIVFNARVVTAW